MKTFKQLIEATETPTEEVLTEGRTTHKVSKNDRWETTIDVYHDSVDIVQKGKSMAQGVNKVYINLEDVPALIKALQKHT